MSNRLYCAALLGVLLSGLSAMAHADGTAAASGVTGRVSVAPSCPGPVTPDRECVAPLAGVGLQLRLRSGKVLGRTVTSSEGAFTIQAPPGAYELQVEVEGLYPRCERLPVRVRKGRLAQVSLVCDSGMR